jgi:hypothetical protein
MDTRRTDFSSALLSEDFYEFRYDGFEDNPFRLKLDFYDYNHIILTCNYANNWKLFFSEISFPGWIVKIDGKPTNFVSGETAFRIIQLNGDSKYGSSRPTSPNNKIIELIYLPSSYKIGLYISLATLLLLSGILSISILMKRKNEEVLIRIEPTTSPANSIQYSNRQKASIKSYLIIRNAIYILLSLIMISGFLFNNRLWMDNISLTNPKNYLLDMQVRTAADLYNKGKKDEALKIIHTLNQNFPEKKELGIIERKLEEDL